MPASSTLPVDHLTGTPGRRPSGAPLYHRGSIFSEPVRHRMDRAVIWRILASAEALEARTRAPGKHGGVLKGKGLDVLRALLRRFYSYRDGTCFPSYDEIAEAAGCCRATVAAKLRILEQYGFIQTIRRKVVASFVSRVARVRFDVAAQTSNSYTFNMPIGERAERGDLAPIEAKSSVSAPKQAESKIRTETSLRIKKKAFEAPPEDDATTLAVKKAHWLAMLNTGGGG